MQSTRLEAGPVLEFEGIYIKIVQLQPPLLLVGEQLPLAVPQRLVTAPLVFLPAEAPRRTTVSCAGVA